MTRLALDILEARETPATLVNPTTLTYTEPDGDQVTLSTSKGTFDLLTDFVFNSVGGEQLQSLNLQYKGEFSGAAIHVSVAAGGPGNEAADIGLVDATGIDLKSLTIQGDLGRVIVGDGLPKTPGLATLAVGSLGLNGTTTQVPGSDLFSRVTGRLNKLTVAGDIVTARLSVLGGPAGDLGSVDIGGDVIGDAAPGSGQILAEGDIGDVRIGGDLRGDTGGNSGTIRAATLGSIRVEGSIIGAANSSGTIQVEGRIGRVFVGGDLRGGTGNGSGTIATLTGGDIGPVTIVGEVRGDANGSGQIETRSGGDIGPVVIGTASAPTGLFGGPGPDAGSIVTNAGGDIASVTVFGDVVGGAGDNSGSIVLLESGDIGPVSLSGALVGGAGDTAGSIRINEAGSIASVTLGGGITGGSNLFAGSIVVDERGGINRILVGGDLVGGTGLASGSILAQDGTLGSVVVEGYIQGGVDQNTGLVFAAGDIASVAVNGIGGIVGNTGFRSGAVHSRAGDIGKVTVAGSLGLGVGTLVGDDEMGSIQAPLGILKNVHIGGDVRGGSVDGIAESARSGYIGAQVLAKVRIVGSLVAGADTSSGFLIDSGAIRAERQIKSLTIEGNVLGDASRTAVISAGGQVNPTNTTDLAIGKVSIGGNAAFLQVLAGYNLAGLAINPNAQIGTVSVAGDWTAGDVVAGVLPTNAFFGDGDDTSMLINDTPAVSRIKTIVIGGTVAGTATAGDSFGFVAEQLVSIKINGVAVALTAGVGNDTTPLALAGATDVFVLEVA